MENKTDPNLSIERTDHLIKLLAEAFDTEFARLPNEEVAIRLANTFDALYRTTNFHTFFVMVNLKNITETIFGDEILRAFLLNLTDRFSFLLDASSISVEKELIPTLVTAITRNKKPPNDDNSLIIKEINAGLYIEEEVLTNILEHNFWIVVFYLLIMFYSRTNTYAVVNKKKANH